MNWDQLQTILWLRWRLMRNQWSRSGGLGAVIAALVGLGAIILGVVCFGVALLAAASGLRDAGPGQIMAVWFGATAAFLFFWSVGLVTEIQRSETIDLQKLLHLPAALGQLFIVNYLVSHVTLSIAIMVPVMMGLAIGLIIARGPEMALMIPLSLSMVVMVTAWTYCLRGWLASIMSNPRRRRTVIMCVSLAFILLAQGPNLYFNVLGRHHAAPANLNQLAAAQDFIPPFWVSIGAEALAKKNPLPALYGTLGCLGLAALGLRQAYRGTIKFYLGKGGGKTAAGQPALGPGPKNERPKLRSRNSFLERKIPAVPEESAAVALATFRSMTRAPEVKMALGGSILSIVVLAVMVLMRSTPQISDAGGAFAATGSAAFATFILIQFFANQFGFDRDAFRSLVLSPADRRLILLGKNLAVMPVGFGLGASLLIVVSVWLRLSPLTVLATLLQLVTLLLIASLGGNLLSILVPYRVQPGTMKPTKMPALATIIMIVCQLLLPLAMSPVFAGPLLEWLWRNADLPGVVPVNLICSTVLLAGVGAIYWQTLPPLGRLLQRREQRILKTITAEVE